MEETKIISCLKALSDETRLEIVKMLKTGTMCACKILERFSLTQPTLSYHMKQLTDCGLVNVDKDWKWSYYSLNPTAIKELRDFFDFTPVIGNGCKCEE